MSRSQSSFLLPNILSRALVGACALALLCGAASGAESTTLGPPVAPMRAVTDDYFGTAVVDNYRYMENLADPEVQGWMKGQAEFARSRLDALPGRAALQERIHQLGDTNLRRGSFVRRGERYFYLEIAPGAQVPKLFYRDSIDGAGRLLLDPATLGAGTSTHFTINYFTPSWDGRWIAYGISSGGSEDSRLHVMEVATGHVLEESIDRAAGSIVTWRADNRSFFYLRYNPVAANTPASLSRYNARSYLHLVGTHPGGDDDAVVFGRGVASRLDVPEGEGTYVLAWPGSHYAIAVANHNMDANPLTLYVAPLAAVKDAATPWRRMAEVDDGVTEVRAVGDQLYFLSKKGAPNFRLLATPLAHPDVAHARVVVPEGVGVLTSFEPARDGLYVRVRAGAVSHLDLVALDGRDSHPVPAPFEGNVGSAIVDARQSGVLFAVQSWVRAPQMERFDVASGSSTDTGLLPPPKVDYSEVEARETFAVSYDGTRIPLSIVSRKGIKLDGTHPTILSGYGSYGNSREPSFNPRLLAWLERGGVYAVAHVRGGGENGDAWHTAGQKLTKMNTVFDFIACGESLVSEHYTAPKLLAGEGGSAGGITVGGAMTWAPERFGTILDLVGISDMLRTETEPNGPPNISEFGSVKTEAGFHGLYAMAAYEHVRDGTPYPAVLFVTGANDPRVAPWHMAKMAARVQAATSSGRPVLLRIDYDAGHGIGSSVAQGEALQADLWAFALWQAGDPDFQPLEKH